jgi:DNA-binding MarR family transcriptional regulator
MRGLDEQNRASDLRRSITRLNRRMRAQRSLDALSANKLGVLSYLYHRDNSSPGEVAAAEHLQPQSLSKLLAELESEGLTSRSKSQTDRRQSVLTITQAGRDALKRDMDERDRWLSLALATLSDTELHVLQIAAPIIERLANSTVISNAQSEESLLTDKGDR